jgi:hypothetical protein
MNYKLERGYVYYKSDEQTWNETRATDNKKIINIF